jgi:Arc/MetJ family transcription regulator
MYSSRVDARQSEVDPMRTNIVLHDVLIKEAMRLAGAATKRETVQMALREFVARRR